MQAFDASGPNSQLGKGLAQMVESELTHVDGGFQPIVVEWARRDEVKQEIERSNSPLADRSTRVPRGRLIEPDVFVRGSVSTTKDATSWSIRMVDAKTGEIIGSESGSAKGEKIFDAPRSIAQRLAGKLAGFWRKRPPTPARHKRPHRRDDGRQPSQPSQPVDRRPLLSDRR